ncbi:hypothetical protein B0A65_17225 [Flavobacterium frigidimaris]|uniref:Uncharacterized protein n=1 Tax=Flavobacterium frigidimaris TaxID=262320 RepID=A0ABX4BMS4_FLAFR|nr:hypothetical protein B0A65_17225 [Flavobacterium frigidimaris]
MKFQFRYLVKFLLKLKSRIPISLAFLNREIPSLSRANLVVVRSNYLKNQEDISYFSHNKQADKKDEY